MLGREGAGLSHGACGDPRPQSVQPAAYCGFCELGKRMPSSVMGLIAKLPSASQQHAASKAGDDTEGLQAAEVPEKVGTGRQGPADRTEQLGEG